jgi:hypothetical protein
MEQWSNWKWYSFCPCRQQRDTATVGRDVFCGFLAEAIQRGPDIESRDDIFIVYTRTSLNRVKHMKCKYLTYLLTNSYRLRLINDRLDLSSEKVPHRDKSNVQVATFRKEVISGHKSQSGLDIKTY